MKRRITGIIFAITVVTVIIVTAVTIIFAVGGAFLAAILLPGLGFALAICMNDATFDLIEDTIKTLENNDKD